MATGFYKTLNDALEAEGLKMSCTEVMFHIGSMVYEQTVSFNLENLHVSIYRRHTGSYEILSYKL